MRNTGARALSGGVGSLLCLSCALAQDPRSPAGSGGSAQPPAMSAEALPVREVTVFKDGHAFVHREAPLPAAAGSELVLQDLPEPLLGTFWPYASGGAKLVSATSAKDRVSIERTALDLRQLLAANVGRRARLVDQGGETIVGTIAAVPLRSAQELERTDPAGGTPRLPEKGTLVLVRISDGTRALPLERVRDVTFLDEPAGTGSDEELRNRLTLRVERTSAAAQVGVVYVQKGLRWIPAYKLELDGEGHATAQLEATLVNDLIDLSNATVNLVIGVPHFEFAGMVDPIALQQIAAQVGRQMQMNNPYDQNFLSNAIMTQSAYEGQRDNAQEQPAAPEVTGGESNEDLFVFTVKNVTLAKGQRLVLPIASFALAYRDVYTLEVPFEPLPEMYERFQSGRTGELAKLLAAPKAMHTLRLTNASSAPLTTAPALILDHGRVLAQGLMTYTPIGGETDLPVTAAIDIGVKKTEKESGRDAKAVLWAGDSYARIDMTGGIELVNHKQETLELEVRRVVLGTVDSADHSGEPEQTSLFEAQTWRGMPPWWSWWSWPYWWHHFNGIGQIRWKLTLKPGETATLKADWHYFWR
jgi:hypothetical protein